MVRIPTGTAHTLDSSVFPIAVMGKTGTTNEFRDALFVGSTFGPEGITVAVRIGFDDNRDLGLTGGTADADDGAPAQVVRPGPDGLLGTPDDQSTPLVGFTTRVSMMHSCATRPFAFL